MKRAQPIADMASSKAARRSGTLAKSAHVGTQLSPRQQALQKPFVTPGNYSTQVYVGFGPLPRAHFQEFGTVNHAPHPALRPAWEAGKETMWAGVIQDMKLHMDRMAAKNRSRE